MVLADRGKRELPISANYVGEVIEVHDEKSLVLEKDMAGKFSFELQGRKW